MAPILHISVTMKPSSQYNSVDCEILKWGQSLILNHPMNLVDTHGHLTLS